MMCFSGAYFQHDEHVSPGQSMTRETASLIAQNGESLNCIPEVFIQPLIARRPCDTNLTLRHTKNLMALQGQWIDGEERKDYNETSYQVQGFRDHHKSQVFLSNCRQMTKEVIRKYRILPSMGTYRTERSKVLNKKIGQRSVLCHPALSDAYTHCPFVRTCRITSFTFVY